MSPPRNPRASSSRRAPWPDRAGFEQLLRRKAALCGLYPDLPEFKGLIADYDHLRRDANGPYLLLARIDPYEGVTQSDHCILVHDVGQLLRPITIARYHATRLAPEGHQRFTTILVDSHAMHLSTSSRLTAQLNAYALIPVGQTGWRERYGLICELIGELTDLPVPEAEELFPERIVALQSQEKWEIRCIMPSTR